MCAWEYFLVKGKLRSENIKHKQLVILKALNNSIKKKYIVLPLFQEVRNFYFPKRIKSLKLGRDNLEYLEIARIKI